MQAVARRILSAKTSADETLNSHAPYRIYNIGNSQPVELMRFIEVIEDTLGIKARKNLMPMQPGDVLETYADTSALKAATGFEPKTGLEEGIAKFVSWYQSYYSSINNLPLAA